MGTLDKSILSNFKRKSSSFSFSHKTKIVGKKELTERSQTILGDYMSDQLQKAVEAKIHFTLLLNNVAPYSTPSLLCCIPEMSNSLNLTSMPHTPLLKSNPYESFACGPLLEGLPCTVQLFTEEEHPGERTIEGWDLVLIPFRRLKMVQIPSHSCYWEVKYTSPCLKSYRLCSGLSSRIWWKWFCTSFLAQIWRD